MSILGANADDMEEILKGLGYRSEPKPAAEVRSKLQELDAAVVAASRRRPRPQPPEATAAAGEPHAAEFADPAAPARRRSLRRRRTSAGPAQAEAGELPDAPAVAVPDVPLMPVETALAPSRARAGRACRRRPSLPRRRPSLPSWRRRLILQSRPRSRSRSRLAPGAVRSSACPPPGHRSSAAGSGTAFPARLPPAPGAAGRASAPSPRPSRAQAATASLAAGAPRRHVARRQRPPLADKPAFASKPREERAPRFDPDSPFAKLAALRDQLKK